MQDAHRFGKVVQKLKYLMHYPHLNLLPGVLTDIWHLYTFIHTTSVRLCTSHILISECTKQRHVNYGNYVDVTPSATSIPISTPEWKNSC